MKNIIKRICVFQIVIVILFVYDIEIFTEMFIYLNRIHYWSFVHRGIDLGLTEEEWILQFLGPNGEVPFLHRAFSNTGYTSSEDDDDMS